MIGLIKKSIASTVLCIAVFVSCSPNDSSNMPYQPPAQVRGRIAVINESNVSIRVVGYTQERGDSTVSINLGVHLFPNQTYYLQNLIERSMGQSFMGGDLVRVTYLADAPDPDNPSEPLFRNTIELTVNGTYYIQVKNGGIYSIYPGN
jgi:hypothetical protein